MQEIKELISYLQAVLVIFGVGALIYAALSTFSLVKFEDSQINERNLKYLLSFTFTSIIISILTFFIIIKRIYREMRKIRAKNSFISPLALLLILVILFVILVLLIRSGRL